MNQTSNNATIQSDLNLQKSILEQRVEELRHIIHHHAVNFAWDLDVIANRTETDETMYPTNLYQGAAEIDSLTLELKIQANALNYINKILAGDAARAA